MTAATALPRRALPHDPSVHSDDFVRPDAALPQRPAFRADMVNDGPIPSEIDDLADLEFLVGGREHLVRNGPVALVHGELHPDLVDALRPDGVDRFRRRAIDSTALRFDSRDRDPSIAQVELLSHGHIFVRGELEGGLLGAIDPRHDQRHGNRFRLARDHVGDGVAFRTPNDALEDDFVLPADLASEDAVRHDFAALRTFQNQGAWRSHRRRRTRWMPKGFAVRALATDCRSARARGRVGITKAPLVGILRKHRGLY